MRKLSALRREETTEDGFLADVLQGLRGEPRAIPPKYFYDVQGSRLFDLICTTPEYYPTRTEIGILERHGAEMAARIGPACLLIELGSGSAVKTPLLLRHFGADTVYLPIDICRPHLLESTRRIADLFPALRMQPLCADYMQLPDLNLHEHAGLRRVVFFPGSTIGNCAPDEAVGLLRHAAALAGASGAMLIGVDAKKSPEILDAAYNDKAGFTAAFNLNLLARMRRELDAELDPDGFAHRAYFDASRGRIEMHLVSRHRQSIQVSDERFHFEQGDFIHTENSYKYSVQEFLQLARHAGWQADGVWSDRAGWFNMYLLTATAKAMSATVALA